MGDYRIFLATVIGGVLMGASGYLFGRTRHWVAVASFAVAMWATVTIALCSAQRPTIERDYLDATRIAGPRPNRFAVPMVDRNKEGSAIHAAWFE